MTLKRKELASGIKKLLKCRKQYKVLLVDDKVIERGSGYPLFFLCQCGDGGQFLECPQEHLEGPVAPLQYRSQPRTPP